MKHLLVVSALGTLLVGGLALAQQPAGPAAGAAPAQGPAPAEASPARPDVTGGSQTGAKVDAKTDATAKPPNLADLAWLEGCWKGNVNRRDYREVWLPLRGNMMIGVSQTVLDDKTDDFEYLRLEARADATFYVAAPGGKNETSFRLVQETVDGEGAHTFVFTDPTRDFPQRISYRRGTAGWLYAEVAGKVEGKERSVIYPMRRIDCASGAFIEK